MKKSIYMVPANYISNRKRGFSAWIIVALISFVSALLINKFPLINTISQVETQDDRLSEWAKLIYERAESHLYNRNRTEVDMANWKFAEESLAAENQCHLFSLTYQQRHVGSLLDSNDFYPPGVNHWNRIDRTIQNRINDQYKHLCFQLSLELVPKIDSTLIETNDPNLLILIVSVINQHTDSKYFKRGLLSGFKSIGVSNL